MNVKKRFSQNKRQNEAAYDLRHSQTTEIALGSESVPDLSCYPNLEAGEPLQERCGGA